MQQYKGKFGEFIILTNEELVKKEGYEYKMVPRFDVPFLRGLFTKTVRVDRYVPDRRIFIIEKEKTLVMHPDVYEPWLKSMSENDAVFDLMS